MRRFLLLMAALVAAICVLAGLTLPPRRITVVPFDDGTIPGVLHIHTNRSDGRSTPDEVAAAAARAGLKFIVFTDHGDGTRQPDPPTYRSGVLCLDGVEIRPPAVTTSRSTCPPRRIRWPANPVTSRGRAPARWLRHRRASRFTEDRAPLGGLGAPIDGVEWVNPDTELARARDGWVSRFQIFAGVLHYQVRPAETLANLLTDISEPISHWNTIAAGRKIVAISGVDAHANLALRNTDPVETRFAFPLPSYEASFRMLSVHITPELPLSGDAAADGAIVMRAIRAGHLYTAIDGVASAPSVRIQCEQCQRNGPRRATSCVPTARSRFACAAMHRLALRRSSGAAAEILMSAPSDERTELTVKADGAPAVYRAEVRSSDPERPRNWLLSNGIYVRGAEAPQTRQSARVEPPPPTSVLALFDGQTEAGWHVETDPSSKAAVEVAKTVDAAELRVRFALAGTDVGDERAALVWGTPIGHAPVNVADYDRFTFTARAERPMRVSVQFRTANVGGTMRRWQRSVFVDTVDEQRTIAFSDLTPSDSSAESDPPLDQISQILFVVDTVNTTPGTAGRFWVNRRRSSCGDRHELDTDYVRTVSIRITAAAANRTLGAQAASTGGSRPPAPIAPLILNISQ